MLELVKRLCRGAVRGLSWARRFFMSCLRSIIGGGNSSPISERVCGDHISSTDRRIIRNISSPTNTTVKRRLLLASAGQGQGSDSACDEGVFFTDEDFDSAEREEKDKLQRKLVPSLLQAIGNADHEKVKSMIDKHPFLIFVHDEASISPLQYAFKLYDTKMWEIFYEKIKDNEEDVIRFFEQKRAQKDYIDLEGLAISDEDWKNENENENEIILKHLRNLEQRVPKHILNALPQEEKNKLKKIPREEQRKKMGEYLQYFKELFDMRKKDLSSFVETMSLSRSNLHFHRDKAKNARSQVSESLKQDDFSQQFTDAAFALANPPSPQ